MEASCYSRELLKTGKYKYSNSCPLHTDVKTGKKYLQFEHVIMEVKYHLAAGKNMKSIILYPYGPISGTGCCRMLHAKYLALISSIYALNISLLIILVYSWLININIKKQENLDDVYYGVQLAYITIIATQFSMVVLSIMLIVGIHRENPGLVVPWIIGFITFMALEAVSMVYSNVLRDHVNKEFDATCKAEVAFFFARAFINIFAIWAVTKFYNLLRSGVTWKGPEVIEL